MGGSLFSGTCLLIFWGSKKKCCMEFDLPSSAGQYSCILSLLLFHILTFIGCGVLTFWTLCAHVKLASWVGYNYFSQVNCIFFKVN